MVWALRLFRAYLRGHKTIVYNDHSPVKALRYAKHTSGKVARWSQVMSEYDLEIRYHPGRQNANTDALSRSPLPGETDIDSLDTVQIATITTEGKGCIGTHKCTVEDVSPVHHMTELGEE